MPQNRPDLEDVWKGACPLKEYESVGVLGVLLPCI